MIFLLITRTSRYLDQQRSPHCRSPPLHTRTSLHTPAHYYPTAFADWFARHHMTTLAQARIASYMRHARLYSICNTIITTSPKRTHSSSCMHHLTSVFLPSLSEPCRRAVLHRHLRPFYAPFFLCSFCTSGPSCCTHTFLDCCSLFIVYRSSLTSGSISPLPSPPSTGIHVDIVHRSFTISSFTIRTPTIPIAAPVACTLRLG
ncbi:hypothetical protein GSI_15394 [Ganoderma sinense ZZ0214-1]|uniref:Uncharacterized protein n=1 Tax=Ganoderma sinense ZZ0214-1 TaxID=1077348 RepID=A0A2G8RMG9_9APHY|nr:hypothetical protein GSI_15394 [Ganoderma sinense ZZ0214-1]